MGYCPDWLRQNMKKTGSSGPTTSSSRKDMGSLFHNSPAPQSNVKPVRLADGDTEETYKARGLEASSGEKVGFFERLRMGNIDDPNSEAYKRLGAGRGRQEAEMDSAIKSFENTRSVSGSDSSSSDSEDRVPMRLSDPAADRATEDAARPRAAAPAPVRRKARSSVSGSVSAAPTRPVSVTDTGDETSRLARRAPAPAPAPAPAAKRSTPFARQLERDEARREARREERRAAARAEDAKRSASRESFNASLRNDPSQRAIRERREAERSMTPAQRSMARGQAIKDFLGLSKDKK